MARGFWPGVLPPGLDGFVAGQETAQRSQDHQMGMLAQLARLQQAAEEQRMNRQLMPLKLQSMMDELADKKAKREFFSPQNQQNYMEGGRPAAMLPEDVQGPVSPAVPGRVNMDRMMGDAAARNFIPPEQYWNHLENRQVRRDQIQSNAEIRLAQIQAQIEDSVRRSEDRNLALEERKAAEKRAADLKVMLTNQSNALAVQLKQMGIDSSHVLARITAANRPDPAPTLVYRSNPDGTTTAVDFRTGREMPGVMPPGAATATVRAASTKKVNQEGVQDAIDTARSILKGEATGTKPTGSILGKGVDYAGSVFGLSPSGAKEASRLKTVGATLMTKVPRFEGPQSDRDTALYREMSARVGDEGVPVDQRLDALEEMEKLHVKYEGGRSSASSPTPSPTSRVRKYNPATGRIE